jgi:hypothetical protein
MLQIWNRRKARGNQEPLVFGPFVSFVAFCKMDWRLHPIAAAKSLQIRLKRFLAGLGRSPAK